MRDAAVGPGVEYLNEWMLFFFFWFVRLFVFFCLIFTLLLLAENGCKKQATKIGKEDFGMQAAQSAAIHTLQ